MPPNQRPAGGSPRVTALDVARVSGVSRTTVSYVLNDVAGQSIPQATRDRVRQAATSLGYVPSAAAASLRRGHSRVILVVTDRALSGFVTEPFLAAIGERFTAADYTTLTYQHESDDALLSLLRELLPFGVMVLTDLSPETLEHVVDAGVPRVYASSHGDPSFPRPWEEEIGAAQAAHLIERGYRDLLYASPPVDVPRRVIADARMRGARIECERRGVPSPTLLEVADTRAAAVGALSVVAGGIPLGVCAFDDTVAMAVLAAAQDMGLAVPRDLAVIGVDDAPLARFTSPGLTTVAIDGRATGLTLASRFLLDDYESALAEPSRAGARIVERAST